MNDADPDLGIVAMGTVEKPCSRKSWVPFVAKKAVQLPLTGNGRQSGACLVPISCSEFTPSPITIQKRDALKSHDQRCQKRKSKGQSGKGRLSSDPPEFRTCPQEVSLAAAPQNVWETN